jgi:hypothetical protein
VVNVEFELADLSHMALGLSDDFAGVTVHQKLNLSSVPLLQVLTYPISLLCKLLAVKFLQTFYLNLML